MGEPRGVTSENTLGESTDSWKVMVMAYRPRLYLQPRNPEPVSVS